jgi:hypothetical protein
MSTDRSKTRTTVSNLRRWLLEGDFGVPEEQRDLVSVYAVLYQAERDTQRLQASHAELVERIALALLDEGSIDPLPGISLARRSSPQEPLHGVFKAMLCVIAQGSREVLLGDSSYRAL